MWYTHNNTSEPRACGNLCSTYTHPLAHESSNAMHCTYAVLCCAGGIWQQDAEATKSQLRGYLKSSGSVWKLVVGHHPIASFGSHCDFRMANDCKEMSWLEPELQVSWWAWDPCCGCSWAACASSNAACKGRCRSMHSRPDHTCARACSKLSWKLSLTTQASVHALQKHLVHVCRMQRAGVAAYMAGHEHDLQHIVKLTNPNDDNSDPVWPQYVVSGAGSETRVGEKKYYKGKVSARRVEQGESRMLGTLTIEGGCDCSAWQGDMAGARVCPCEALSKLPQLMATHWVCLFQCCCCGARLCTSACSLPSAWLCPQFPPSNASVACPTSHVCSTATAWSTCQMTRALLQCKQAPQSCSCTSTLAASQPHSTLCGSRPKSGWIWCLDRAWLFLHPPPYSNSKQQFHRQHQHQHQQRFTRQHLRPRQ